MRCPECDATNIRASECYEVNYEVCEDGAPGEMTNYDTLLDGPEEYYYRCLECLHRWDVEGHSLAEVFTVPDRI